MKRDIEVNKLHNLNTKQDLKTFKRKNDKERENYESVK